jgi:polysaccharide export outer membrane protein
MIQFSIIISGIRRSSCWLFLFAVACLFSSLSSAEQGDVANPATSEYRLGVGDRIQIDVYGEADLDVTTTLSESGVISYPFLGDLKITGYTTKEVGQLITSGLKGAYLVDPKISVTILQYRPFYIHGEVKQSGGFPYQPGLTLRKAVSLAGGFTDRASSTKMSVIRETDVQRKPVPIKLDDSVYPGDTVTIEQGFF